MGIIVPYTTDGDGKLRPNWGMFWGNHHNRLPKHDQWGGGISFAEHIGKPLTDALWDDLVSRTPIETILIYRPNEPMWTIGWSRAAIIHLDENSNVRDIHLYF